MLKHPARALCLLLPVLAAGCDSGAGPTTPIVFVGPSNLVITDVRVGTGAAVAAGQTATVHYGLWLYDPKGTDSKGTLIQDSRQAGNGQPFAAVLKPGSLIQGWIEGVPGMKVGGLRRLVIPPSLAYGTLGSGPIPPNAWLVFDIDLISVRD